MRRSRIRRGAGGLGAAAEGGGVRKGGPNDAWRRDIRAKPGARQAEQAVPKACGGFLPCVQMEIP